MKKSQNPKRRSLSDNIAKIALVEQAPKLAKLIVEAIPDLTYEKYIKNYRKLWNIALPASSLALLRKFSDSDNELLKTFIVNMSAQIRREINERAKKGEIIEEDITNEEQGYEDSIANDNHQIESPEFEFAELKIKDCLGLLNQRDFAIFTKRLNQLPAEQKEGMLNSIIPTRPLFENFIKRGLLSELPEKKMKEYSYNQEVLDKIYYIESLIAMDEQSFKTHALVLFDKKHIKQQEELLRIKLKNL